MKCQRLDFVHHEIISYRFLNADETFPPVSGPRSSILVPPVHDPRRLYPRETEMQGTPLKSDTFSVSDICWNWSRFAFGEYVGWVPVTKEKVTPNCD